MNGFGIMRQLAAPLRYYQFYNKAKLIIDVIAPLLFAFATCILFSLVPGGVAFLGDHGFVNSINGLLQLLVGFFVAGLAAVFGVRGYSLEQKPVGFHFLGAVKRDDADGVKITRRMFVCALFAYLAFISFSLFLVGLFAATCQPLIRSFAFGSIVHNLICFVYVLFIWNIFFVTLYGFYYMVDRAHRGDPEVLDGPIDASDEN